MKRLFRFTHYRRVAVWLFGAVWLAGGSLVAAEDALSDPVASSQARPVFQTLSTIHHTLLPDGSIQDVCPGASSIAATVGLRLSIAPAVLTAHKRFLDGGLDAVDLCDVVASCQHRILVANPATEGRRALVEAGSDSGWDVSTGRTSSIFGSRTSRGGPPGQAGLGDPGLPFTRPLLAGTFRPPGHTFPRETTTGTQVTFKAVDTLGPLGSSNAPAGVCSRPTPGRSLHGRPPHGCTPTTRRSGLPPLT